MDIDKLHVLLQVVDCGSLQRAARQHGLSRSLVRRRIEALEREVGAPLILRSATGVTLTAAGAVVVERGRSLVASAQELMGDALVAARRARGVLRIFEPLGLPVMARVAGMMATRGALADLRLVVRQVEDPLAHIEEPFELMVHEGLPPAAADLYSRVVLRVAVRLFASPGYLEARGVPESVSDLERHEILSWLRPGEDPSQLPLLDGGKATTEPWLATPDLALLKGIAGEGGGIVLAPDAPFLVDPWTPELVKVLEDTVGKELVVRVTTPQPARADARTRGALAQLHATLDSLAPL